MHTNSTKLQHRLIREVRYRDELIQRETTDVQDYQHACCEERQLAQIEEVDLPPLAFSLMS